MLCKKVKQSNINVMKKENEAMTEANQILPELAIPSQSSEYLKEVFEELQAESPIEAMRWVELLRLFSQSDSEFDMDEEDDFSDPIRNVSLVQSNTTRPRGVYPGVFFDKVTEEVVAETTGEDDAPSPVDGFPLVFYKSRTMFGDSKSPICWSKDGVINRHGGLCKKCPHFQTLSCTKSINVVWVNSDLTHMFKLSFSKTAFKTGNMLLKRLRTLKSPFSVVSSLSAKVEKNNKGEWFSTQISVGKNAPSEAKVKALRILAELYTAVFKEMKSGLKDLHEAYLSGGGASGGSLEGPGTAPQIGAGDAFGNEGDSLPVGKANLDDV